jgi:hypothetical protein
MSIALLSYLGSDGAMQTAFAAGDARLVAKYLSKAEFVSGLWILVCMGKNLFGSFGI